MQNDNVSLFCCFLGNIDLFNTNHALLLHVVDLVYFQRIFQCF